MGFFKRSEPTYNTREIETVNTALETVFPHPSEIGSEAGAILLCYGELVRTILPPASDLAAAIRPPFSDYQFAPFDPLDWPGGSK